MLVSNFTNFIKNSRKEFRNLITNYLDGRVEEMKRFVKNKIDECESEFEVNTLKENLQEEFALYLNELEGE